VFTLSSACVAYLKLSTFRVTTAAALQDAVGGFLPALSFYPPSPRLWRTSLSMGLFLSFQFPRFEIVVTPSRVGVSQL